MYANRHIFIFLAEADQLQAILLLMNWIPTLIVFYFLRIENHKIETLQVDEIVPDAKGSRNISHSWNSHIFWYPEESWEVHLNAEMLTITA